MKTESIARLICVAAMLIWITVGPVNCMTAVAQDSNTPTITLDRKLDLHYKHLSMPEMLHDLCKRTGVPVLADGVPLLATADLDFNGPVREALSRIADVFDYTVATGKSRVIILTKRFTNPNDLPQLNVPEIRQTAIDMLKVLPPCPYDPSPTAFANELRGLAQSLSPDQFAALNAGKRLTFADLLPAQREGLLAVIRQRAYGMPVSVWELVCRRLDGFDESVLRLEKQGVYKAVDGTTTDVFGIFHESRSRNGQTTKSPLGNLQRKVTQ